MKFRVIMTDGVHEQRVDFDRPFLFKGRDAMRLAESAEVRPEWYAKCVRHLDEPLPWWYRAWRSQKKWAVLRVLCIEAFIGILIFASWYSWHELKK